MFLVESVHRVCVGLLEVNTVGQPLHTTSFNCVVECNKGFFHYRQLIQILNELFIHPKILKLLYIYDVY